MADWQIFVQMGIQHITDFGAYDHMLFLATICALYRPQDWQRLLLLVTAFTIGHSATLIMGSIWGSFLSVSLTEWLVGLSILLGGVYNLIRPLEWHRKNRWPSYTLALGFGLIHGLAFSGFFQGMGFISGELIVPLLSFNLGVEAGQLLIVGGLMLVAYLITEVGKINFRYWMLGLSFLAIAGGTLMVIQRWPW